MKKMRFKKVSFMFLLLVVSVIFAAGCNKSPKDGGETSPTTTDGNWSQKETDETTKEADTTVPTAEESTDTTADAITETTEAETETTTVEEVKPWDLLNNEPLNPTTSGYDELDRLVEGFMNKLKDDGVISDDMSNYQKVHNIYVWFIKNIQYNRGMDVNAGASSASDPATTPVEVLWATDLFNTYNGCCYNYSSAFMYVMRYLGYDAHLVSGQVGKYGGGTTPHCWLYVNLGGVAYTFDPDVDSNYYWRGVTSGSTEENTDTLFCKKMDDMGYFYITEKYHDI
mgnify:FL=1